MRGPGEPARHRPSAGRRGRLRWAAVAGVAVVLGAVLAVVSGLGSPPGSRHADARAPGTHVPRHRVLTPQASSTTTTTVPPATTTTTVPPATTTTTGPGTLPQTTTLPASTSPQFHAEMADLWQGVVLGTTSPAMPAFFPVGAYLQLKTIPDPQQDWQDRLVGDFTLDLAAAHSLLGSTASSAQLVGVTVPTQYAHWVTPGVCDNGIGYYEVPNARVVYQVGGVVRSFGIASMISWRGQWYVVHLGAVLRTTPAQGIVDAPATGPGTSAYSSTC